MTQAKVSVTTIDNQNIDRHFAECSSDLPDEAIGEIVGNAIRKAWGKGIDPSRDNLTVVIQFR